MWRGFFFKWITSVEDKSNRHSTCHPIFYRFINLAFSLRYLLHSFIAMPNFYIRVVAINLSNYSKILEQLLIKLRAWS